MARLRAAVAVVHRAPDPAWLAGERHAIGALLAAGRATDAAERARSALEAIREARRCGRRWHPDDNPCQACVACDVAADGLGELEQHARIATMYGGAVAGTIGRLQEPRRGGVGSACDVVGRFHHAPLTATTGRRGAWRSWTGDDAPTRRGSADPPSIDAPLEKRGQ